MGEIVLVVAAHTDDETFGVGGAIARHRLQGDQVFAIAMTDGVGARDRQDLESVDQRTSAAQTAAEILGFEWFAVGDFPDNELDTVSLLAITKFIETAKQALQPTLIYTHSPADLNIDHRRVCQATLTAFRPQPWEVWQEVRAFEVPSATDFAHPDVTAPFSPNLYVAIDSVWDKKLEALQAYCEEMREAPHTRSYQGLETLAKYRGHQGGVARAEAFQVLRKIVR